MAEPLTEAYVRSRSRHLDLTGHRRVGGLTRDAIYDHGQWMAPGGLLLADLLADTLQLQPGQRVLDAGCGRGQSSVLLAERYGVEVISVDLWIGSADRQRRAAASGVDRMITPLQGNIARGLPIQSGTLDAIFSLQAFHTFGTTPATVTYLSRLLKPGGRLAIAQGCFRDEPVDLPPLFQATDGWHVEYDKYHSAPWWRDHLERNGNFHVTTAEELAIGDILWEDDLLYKGERAKWSPEFLEHSAWLIHQILSDRTSPPTLTHCLVVAQRPPASPTEPLNAAASTVHQTLETIPT